MNDRDFIVKLINSWNPDIDTSEGSEFDQKFIQPLLEYIGTDPFETDTDLITFLQEKVRSYDSSINPVPGTAIYDLLIAPLYLILTSIRREINQYRDLMDITKYDSLSEEDMDALAANFLLTRRSGTKASTVVRVYFTTPVNVTIFPTAYFATSDGLKFYPTTTVQMNAEAVALNWENGLYYVEVPVEAEKEGSEYNVRANSIVTASGLRGYIKITNPYPVINGTDKETNAELYQRILSSITERTPTTERGIRTLVLENFPYISYVNVIGAADPAMTRDLIPIYTDSPDGTGKVVSTYIKTGNKIDVYALTKDHQIKSIDIANISTELKLSYEDEDGNFISLIDLPAIRILDIEILDPATLRSTGNYIPRRDPIGIQAVSNFSGGEVGTATGVIRLFYSRPTRVVVTTSTVFTSSNGYEFIPQGISEISSEEAKPGQIISAPEMDSQREVVGDITYYYVDIPVMSLSTGDANANIEANTSFTVEGLGGDGWWLETEEPSLTFSPKEKLTLRFSDTYTNIKGDDVPIDGSSIRIYYETSETISELQSFLENEEYRCVVVDPLAKAYEPIYVHVYVQFSGNIDEETALQLIQAFLIGTKPGEYLKISGIVDTLYDAGATYVSLPIIALLEYHRSDRKIETIAVRDRYQIPRTAHVMLGTIAAKKV